MDQMAEQVQVATVSRIGVPAEWAKWGAQRDDACPKEHWDAE
jgi:hypothetical protein